jgi:hypothetical protein
VGFNPLISIPEINQPRDQRNDCCRREEVRLRGISQAGNAKMVRKQPDGTVAVTDGPYTETKEHMGGFWILEAADMDEALAWARKGFHLLRCGGRGARASILPGSGTRTRRKQVNSPGRRDFAICTVAPARFFERMGIGECPSSPQF